MRSGNVNVARATAAASAPGRAVRTCRRTSVRLTSRSAHARSPSDAAIPMRAGRLLRRSPRGAGSGLLKRQRHEVEQFLEQWLERFETRLARKLGGDLVSHGCGTFERGVTPIRERCNGDRLWFLLSLSRSQQRVQRWRSRPTLPDEKIEGAEARLDAGSRDGVLRLIRSQASDRDYVGFGLVAKRLDRNDRRFSAR